MTQQEKQLLLIDICARLPHNIKVHYPGLTEKMPKVWDLLGINQGFCNIIAPNEIKRFSAVSFENLIPYLRPMSSMTISESFEFNGLRNETADFDWEIISYKIYDWLNAHHFDYRGLIPKGLALEAPKDMYNTKNK